MRERDHIQCPACDGTGRGDGEKGRCDECGGAGQIPTDFYASEIEGARAHNERAAGLRDEVGPTDEYLNELADDARDAAASSKKQPPTTDSRKEPS